MAGRRYCPGCFEKQSKIDQLLEENERLRQKLRYEQRKAQEGFFGSSTSSSKVPVKGNQAQERKPKEPNPGTRGLAGKGLPNPKPTRWCSCPAGQSLLPDCGGAWKTKGSRALGHGQ